MISRRRFFLGAACSASLASAQDVTFSTGVKVVSILATVHDKDGRVVKDLNKEDFSLFDDGKLQTIRYFSSESDLPLTIGLLVDTSRSQMDVLEPERNASYTFLSQVLREKVDQGFVVSFNFRVEVLQEITSSKREIRAALDRLRIPAISGTALSGGVVEASGLIRERPGRKAFIVLSDGVYVRDTASIDTAIDMAQKAEAIIYTIRYSGADRLDRPARMFRQAVMAENGRQVLGQMSAQTGGEEFEVSVRKPIEQVFSEIEKLLRSQYSIGFTPDSPGGKGKFHKIKLTARDKGLTVLTRAGYYAQ